MAIASSGSEDPDPSKVTPSGAVPDEGVGVRTACGGNGVAVIVTITVPVRLVVSVTVKRAVKVPMP
jgi:hypothetical protein